MTEELKPVRCGCGGEAWISHGMSNGQNDCMIVCTGCGISTRYFNTESEAIEAWNRAMGERTAKVNVLYRDESVIFGHCECGQAVNTYSTYCPKCGARLEWE